MAEQNIEEMISSAIVQYNITDAYLAEAKERAFAIKVEGPEDTKGAETAMVVHAEIRDKRLMVEKTRKTLKEDALRYGQAVDGEARRIRETLESCETHLKEQFEIVTKHQERVEKERIERAMRELEEREAAEKAAKEKAEADERERIRLEELEAAREEAAEKARKDAEEKAERDRKEAEERIARAEEEAEKAKKAAAETEERVRREAEERAIRVKKEAEEAAVREKQAQERKAAEDAAAEADRRANAPNREKMLRYADDLLAVNVPPVTGKYTKTMDAALGLVSDAVKLLRDGAK